MNTSMFIFMVPLSDDIIVVPFEDLFETSTVNQLFCKKCTLHATPINFGVPF